MVYKHKDPTFRSEAPDKGIPAAIVCRILIVVLSFGPLVVGGGALRSLGFRSRAFKKMQEY